MTIFFTSDAHFGHEKIIKYCKRPFNSIEEMDSVLIDNWNSKIGKKGDSVYFLGDFTLGNKIQAQKYFSQLNGKIYVISTKNHHDRGWLKKNVIYRSKTNKIVEILPPIFEMKYFSRYIVTCHFPMLSWNKSSHGSYHFHGHSHGNVMDFSGFFDVGVDCWNFFPVTFEEIVSKDFEIL